MKLLEVIKKKKGVVDIDTFRNFIFGIIMEYFENEEHFNIYYMVEYLILAKYLYEDLNELELKTFTDDVWHTYHCLEFNEPFYKLSQRDEKEVMWNIIYSLPLVMEEEDFNELKNSDEDINLLYENVEYVESGNLPNSAIEGYTKDDLLLVVDSIYNYIFSKKLK